MESQNLAFSKQPWPYVGGPTPWKTCLPGLPRFGEKPCFPLRNGAGMEYIARATNGKPMRATIKMMKITTTS
jgi:hypothetical protein